MRHTDANMHSYSDYPTSPWTEAYQAAPCQQPKHTEESPKPAFDMEAQRPTQDALSAIYNRGYEMAQQESAFLFN